MQFFTKVKYKLLFSRKFFSQELPQGVQAVDLEVRHDVRTARLVLRIEPAGLYAGVFAAEDVAGQAVADHQRPRRVEAVDVREAVVKIGAFGLVVPRRLGDEDVLEIMPDARALQARILRLRDAVRGEIQVVFRREVGKQRLRAGHEIVAHAEVGAVDVLGGGGVVRRAQLGKQNGEAPDQDGLARDLAALERLPLRLVDLAVALQKGGRRLDADVGEGFRDGDALRRAEVEQGVVEVEEDGLEHGALLG